MSYVRTDGAAQRRSRMVRWGVLGVVLATITGIVTAHQYITGAGRPVSVDALCPFGGLETLFTFISGSGFVEKTAASGLILLVGTIVMALVYRRSFCGQICPLGTLQGLLGSLGGRVFKKRLHMPAAVDRVARYLKYVVLAVFIVWTWQAASLVMRPYDPWAAFAHITSAELFATFGVGVGVLVVALVGSFVYERFFCKYLCPMGAFLGIFSKLSVFGIKRDADACISCKACDAACPMNIEVSTKDSVKSSECISCNECVNACPASGALQVKAGNGRRVSALGMTGIVVGVLVVIMALTTAAGAFAWQMPSLKAAIEQSGASQPGVGAGEDPAATSEFDTSVIKGYMSMKEIADATGLPEHLFVEKWGVPEADIGKPMKEISEQYGFSPDDVKVWVGEQLAK